MVSRKLHWILVPALYCLVSSVAGDNHGKPLRCPPEGALLPRPVGLSSNTGFRDAASNLTEFFDNLVSGDIKASFDIANTSFAVSFVGQSRPISSDPLYIYGRLSDRNVNGTDELNRDSQWLIGSVSKLFSDIIFFKSGVNPSDKVTKWLPALNRSDSIIQWNDVTLEALGSHLAGIPPNYGYPEVYELVPLYESLGFPSLEESDFPICGVIGLSPACNQTQLLEAMLKVQPVTAVNERAVYSNVAFILLSYALHNATGKNYTELLDELILTPLNLENTGKSPGDSEKAVIPPVMNGWGADYGDNTPPGGLYSSLNDLSTLTLTILNKTIFPYPDNALTRKWLKPTAHTTVLEYSVGAPWEIYRTTNLTYPYPHTVDLYCKDGGAFGYTARLCTIDQYGVGFVVLVAGDTSALGPIAEAAVSSLLPSVEQAARDEAAANYVGVYESTTQDDVPSVANFTIDDGPGLRLNSLTRNGSDILAGIKAIWDSQPVSMGELSSEFRLYPAEISRASGLGMGAIVREDWTLALEIVAPEQGDDEYENASKWPSSGAFSKPCTTFQTFGLLQYGGQAIDRFVFVLNITTREVIGLEIPFLRANLAPEDDD